MKELSDISFLHGYTERDDYEMPAKGYRDDIIVKFKDGSESRLCFYDITRLAQDIQDEKVIFSKGLVIVEEVTKENIYQTVKLMINSKYFESNDK